MARKAASASPEFYRRLYEYNRKVLEAYADRNARIGRKEARRDRGTGIGSMRETLVHIIRVYDAWLNYVVRGDLKGLHASHDAFVKDYERQDPRAYLRATWKGVDAYLEALDARELERVVKAPWMPGHYTVADVLMQCTFEQAHHLGEMIGAFWRVNKASPQMMWIPTLTGKKVSVA
jgi:uncharacterized damage-inducible protein DinB